MLVVFSDFVLRGKLHVFGTLGSLNFYKQNTQFLGWSNIYIGNLTLTIFPLSIQTFCELHRHVASPNGVIFSIRRLHWKHLACAHAVASILISNQILTISICIPPWTLRNAFVRILTMLRYMGCRLYDGDIMAWCSKCLGTLRWWVLYKKIYNFRGDPAHTSVIHIHGLQVVFSEFVFKGKSHVLGHSDHYLCTRIIHNFRGDPTHTLVI